MKCPAERLLGSETRFVAGPLDLISNCQKLHERWLFLIPKALSGIINDCKMFHDPAAAVVCIQYNPFIDLEH